MSYNGLEIDVISLGDADSILVTRWSGTIPTVVLVDGGNSSDGQKVLQFLRNRGVKYIHHIVCSHPHEDHAAGLIDVVNNIPFGQAWMHLPDQHANLYNLRATLSASAVLKVRKMVEASLDIHSKLHQAILSKYRIVSEPFTGQSIGFLYVCGPSQQFYEQQLAQFEDIDKVRGIEQSLLDYERQLQREEYLTGLNTAWGRFNLQREQHGLGEAPTEPENETSTILTADFNGSRILLTADAGVQALTQAANAYQLKDIYYMQIPHHGSRRNVNPSLISLFRPKFAFVSAAGNDKHPRRMVVNAFKDIGASVYSTHYPNEEGVNLHFALGNVPPRPDYGPAVPLYEATNR